jgi:DNA-directed RNA polymerase subunit beta
MNSGFIETPYRRVSKGRVTDEIQYLSALEEEQYYIAQANAPIDKDGYFYCGICQCQKGGGFLLVKPDEAQYMDVSPKQLVSVFGGPDSFPRA